MRHITLITAVLALAIATPAIAGKGGNGNDRGSSGSCSVEGNVVHGSDLPTWTLVNFMVTDSSGTRGWVLGYTDDGSWDVTVPAAGGDTKYEFAGVTYGKDGTKYDVYASCSA
jgi:hypothetical protein